MKVLSSWLRSYVPGLIAPDRELADALTLRGIAVDGVFELGPDQGSLFEMDITTNRVDAMNHYGIAREAAALYSLPLAPVDVKLPAAGAAAAPVPAAPVRVTIEAPDLCGRFTARVLRGVRIQPSTGVVAERFALLEQKLISNAVDATNYVTMAIGHPTHAFDLDKLEGGIILRRARKGERLRTLDGIERTLDPDDLVVADERKALALAGVMGGWDTMITPETQNILVEAAWFDPASVRRSSRRHGLHTDASHRFERGADFNAPPLASALVAQIILAAGGTVEGDLIDAVVPEAAARTANRPPVILSHAEVPRILGATTDGQGINADMSEAVLTALGCSLARTGEDAYAVTLPSWRLDLERDIDLIEEIARVYGYNRFADTLPAFSGTVVALPNAAKETAVRATLLALGWNEAVSSTFCSATDAVTFARAPGLAVAMGNPLNEEAGVLRPSLLPGMLTMVANNLNRGIEDVALFEMGTAFSGNTDRVEERPALAFAAAGSLVAPGPHQRAEPVNFYHLKGTVEAILARFALRSSYFDTFPAEAGITPSWLHPGRSARAVADAATVGWIGQLHPAEAQRRKLKQDVYLGELYMDRLYKLPLYQPFARELSRYQPVDRDFSFVFPDAVQWSAISEALLNLRIDELKAIAPREIYRDAKGKTVPAQHYSLLLRLRFQALDRTLREPELQAYAQRVVETLQALGGRQRA